MADATPHDDPRGNLAPVITWRSMLVSSVDCSTCKLVGLVLSLYMNERGGSAFPSNTTLADDCSLAVSTVREHLNSHLYGGGWLELVERGGQKGDRRKANEWQASTPPGAGGVPHREDSRPHRETASTPPGAGPQVVHGTTHEEKNGHRPLVCPLACGATFSSTDERDEHYQTCGSDPFDGIPSADEAESTEYLDADFSPEVTR